MKRVSDEEMRALWQETGGDIQKIACRTGYSVVSVYQRLPLIGITWPKWQRDGRAGMVGRKANDEEMLALWAETNGDIAEIARRSGYSKNRVYQRLQDVGLGRRQARRGAARLGYRIIAPEAAVAAYREHGTLRGASQALGTNLETVRLRLIAAGVARRRERPAGSPCPICGAPRTDPARKSCLSQACRSEILRKAKQLVPDAVMVLYLPRLGAYGTARHLGLAYNSVYRQAQRMQREGKITLPKAKPWGYVKPQRAAQSLGKQL